MSRIARRFLLAGFGFAVFAGNARRVQVPGAPSLPAPRLPDLPKLPPVKLPPVHVPPVHLPSPPKLPPVRPTEPPIHLPPVKLQPVKLPPAPEVHVPRLSDIKVPPVKLPTVNVPPVHVPDVKLPTVKIPPVHVPDVKLPTVKVPPIRVPDVKVPTVNLPTVKLPPIGFPTLKPPTPTVFTDPESGPSRKPNGPKPAGPTLGNSVPGIPTNPKPPTPPGVATKPNVNVNVVVIPTGLLGGLNRPGGVGPGPVIVNPQPVVVDPQPVVSPGQPVVVPDPTPEPIQTEATAETPAQAGNTTALRVKERYLDGVAAKAGIQIGDILISAGGKRLRTAEDLQAAAAKGKLDVVYFDAENNKVATCQLTGEDGGFGIMVEAVAINLDEEEENTATPEPAIPEGTPTALQVAEVTARGPAARAGLQPGDVIVAVGGKRVETVAALAAALKAGGEVDVLFVNPEDGKADTRKIKVVNGDIGVTVKLVAVSEK